jgi:hypothetical protein
VDGGLGAALDHVEGIFRAVLDGVADGLGRVLDAVRRFAGGVADGVSGAAEGVTNFAEETHGETPLVVRVWFVGSSRVPGRAISAARQHGLVWSYLIGIRKVAAIWRP